MVDLKIIIIIIKIIILFPQYTFSIKLTVKQTGILTRRLEVKTTELNGVGGVVKWHFFAVGETTFSSFRFCSFSVEQI